jgi:hypothetical protein
MINFCKYKNILGIPKEGIHSYRIADIAIVDVILTILLAIFLTKILNKDFFLTLIFTFLLGIFAHRLFCVETTVDKLLFSSKSEKINH